MNKIIGEGDWSSQEVFHILFNIPLQSGSREIITLDCNQRLPVICLPAAYKTTKSVQL
jgi:hypothetical protein